MQPDLRPAQQEILTYRSGWMGISAVPGSGKTFTLSALAANIVHQGWLGEDQEVLVVTLVNSAVDNFSRRVAGFLQEDHILPGMGYRVRTLHGLAHDIIRACPTLAGLTSDFSILDEHESEQILTGSIHAWIQTHPEEIAAMVEPEVIRKYGLAGVQKKFLPAALSDTCNAFIRTAKDRQLSPDIIQEKLQTAVEPYPLVQMCVEVYRDYQRALTYRNSLDFDDLISTALSMLQADPALTEQLRRRWPYILEDEAQDSSRLQQEILRQLAGENGNWVRVGDPNQAIYETFTTANPKYLRDFVQNPQVQAHNLPASGRSSRKIIRLANYFIDWVVDRHPNPAVRSALGPPHIEPVEEDDPFPNPLDAYSRIQVIGKVYSSDDELNGVAISAGRWVKDHPDQTVAVLAQQNKHMEALAEILKCKGIPYVELLRSTSSTRESVSHLTAVINALVHPRSGAALADAFKAWALERSHTATLNPAQEQTCERFRKMSRPEEFFYPLAGDLLEEWKSEGMDIGTVNSFSEFRSQMKLWFEAITLPVDQLLLTIAQDLFNEVHDLALVHKIAVYLLHVGQFHPEWRLSDFLAELNTFASVQRKVIGFSDEDAGFDPKNYPGKIVLATLHKAKGLEWDKVYLTSVNNFDFPSGVAGEEYYSERWFLRGQVNLMAETLAELDHLVNGGKTPRTPPGEATLQERNKLVLERLRLLYVGITRAKSGLVITCNNGSQQKAHPAIPMIAIQQYLDDVEEGEHDSGN